VEGSGTATRKSGPKYPCVAKSVGCGVGKVRVLGGPNSTANELPSVMDDRVVEPVLPNVN
jgi:hypothetical protein